MADITWYVLSFSSLCCVVVLAQAPDPPVYIYKRVGDSVILECKNVIKNYQECKSVTWLYGTDTSQPVIELVRQGQRRQDNLSGSKASRLSLQPDCFLHISDINVGDAGAYICRQYDSNGMEYGEDETYYLSVLSGTTQKDSFTCSVHCYDRVCERFSLRWSDNVTSDSTSQQEMPGQCVARRPNAQPLDSAGLRCLLMEKGVEKVSVDFASKVRDQSLDRHTNITSGGPGGTRPPYPHKELLLYLAVAVGIGLLVLIATGLKVKRTGNKQSAPKCAEDPEVMGSSGQGEPTQCLSDDQGEPDGRLVYASIEHSRKAGRHSVDEGGSDGDDTVTYSTISKPPATVPEHSCR